MLFGDQLAQEVKEREDQPWAMDRATNCTHLQRPQNFETATLTVSAEGAAGTQAAKTTNLEQEGNAYNNTNTKQTEEETSSLGVERKEPIKKTRVKARQPKTPKQYLHLNLYPLFVPLLIIITRVL